MKYLLFILFTATTFAVTPTINLHSLAVFDSQPSAITDLSGEGNDSTVYGSQTMTTDGYDFHTYYDYTETATKFFITNDWSVSYWYNTTTNNGQNLSWTGVSIAPYYQQGIFIALSRLFFIAEDGTIHTLNYSYSLNTWRNIVVTHDAANTTIKAYTNGVYSGSIEYTGTLKDDLVSFYIGGKDRIPAQKYKDVAMWKRTLTGDEASTIYASGRNAAKDVISTNGLVLFYSFKPDSKSITTFENKCWDRSGNGNDGIIYGGATLGNGELEFDGVDDYVDTGLDIIPNATYVAKIKVYDTVNDDMLFGVRRNNGFYLQKFNTYYRMNVYIGGSGHLISTNAVDLNYHTLTLTNTGTISQLKIDGIVGITNQPYLASGNTLVLGATRVYGTPTSFGHSTFDDWQVWTNGVLIQHFDFTRDSNPVTIKEPTYYYDDLAAWYPFQTSASPTPDKSKNSNDGNIYNIAWQGNGAGYYFDGTDSYISCEYDDNIGGNTTSITVSAFIYITENKDYTYDDIPIVGRWKDKAANAENNNFQLSHGYDAYHKPIFEIWTTEGLASCVGSTHLSLNTWYMLTGTYDGQTVKVYINGVLDNTETTSGFIGSSIRPVRIGIHGYGKFVGNINDVRIYDRALSQEEISNMYIHTLH